MSLEVNKMNRIIIAYISVICAFSSLNAGQKIDYWGISLTFPDYWIILTDEDKINNIGLYDSIESIDTNQDYTPYSILAANSDKDGFAENIGVRIKKGILLVDSFNKEEYNTLLKNLLARTSIELISLDGKIININHRKSLFLEIELYNTSANTFYKQYQAHIPGESSTYEITCTALDADFNEFVPIFNKVIMSAQITEKSRLYTSKYPGWLRTLIPICIVLFLYYAFRAVYLKVFKRKSINKTS